MIRTAYHVGMASAITHFLVGASVGLPAIRSRWIPRALPAWAIPVTAGLLAVAPDLDTYAMFAFHIPRGSLFSHRGFFHSPFFLVILCAVLAESAARRYPWRVAAGLAALWSAAAITHPLLDMFTDGGTGVALLYPYSAGRLFFPWRPIHVSPLGIAPFFRRAGYILRSEFPFDVAAIVLGVTGLLLRRRS
jgi:inner membrane protein